MPSDTEQQLNDDWMPLADAARTMLVNEKYLRTRDGLGHYTFAPEIERWQRVARGKLFLRRSHVLAWKQEQEARARQQAEAACGKRPVAAVVGYEGAREALLRIGGKGAENTMRALGLVR